MHKIDDLIKMFIRGRSNDRRLDNGSHVKKYVRDSEPTTVPYRHTFRKNNFARSKVVD